MCGTSEYQNIEESQETHVQYAEPAVPKVAIVVDDYPQKAAVGSTAGKDQHAPVTGHQRAMAEAAPTIAHAAALSFITPREEDEIACGIELEAAKSDFQFNGVKHPAGTIRIVRLHKDGVCEVWRLACLVET